MTDHLHRNGRPGLPDHATRQSGFTLIELLIVIAIVAVLVAIILPIYSKVQLSGKVAKTVATERQIATAVLSYCGDNNESLPLMSTATSTSGYKPPYWIDSASTYLSPPVKNLITTGYSTSPSLLSPLLSSTQHHEFGDFGCNRQVMLGGDPYGTSPAYTPLRLSLVPHPPQTVMFVTATERLSPIQGTWYIDASSYVSSGSTHYTPSDQNSGRMVAAFVDGHVEAIPKADFLKNRSQLLLLNPPN